MPFGITGFGAQQSYPAPQIFQALSLSGAPPVPPAPPYGNPNENLVPVARTGNPAFPANLTVVAHLTYQAVLNATQLPPLKPSTAAKVPVVVPNTNAVLTHVRPEVTAVANTTNAVSAPNPAVAGQVQGPSSTGIPARIDLPEGLVSFQVLAAPSSVSQRRRRPEPDDRTDRAGRAPPPAGGRQSECRLGNAVERQLRRFGGRRAVRLAGKHRQPVSWTRARPGVDGLNARTRVAGSRRSDRADRAESGDLRRLFGAGLFV